MAPGSVVVDLAAETGGNVEGVVAGKVVRVGSVQLWGGANVPSQMPAPASRLYAQNLLNVIMLMTRDGRFAPNFDDEITAAMCVTHAGKVLRDSDPIIWLTIFVLAIFVGVEVISKVSSTLHTPLMSGANAIHGVILIGAILVTGSAQSPPILVLGLVAVVLASINMVGGFVVTDRMLVMFSRPKRALEKPGRRELEQ
jgi:NAD(P) transhydrogenase subunit alpha